MFRRGRRDEDFTEEIRAHIELEAAELRNDGLSDQEAHRRAKATFGSVSTARERFHLSGRAVWLENLLRDFRFALHQLARNLGFAAVTIVVLALGMGASIAIFSFVDAALFEPLPYR